MTVRTLLGSGRVVTAVVVAALAASCASGVANTSSNSSPALPSSLLGVWQVSAQDEDPEAKLTLGDGFDLVRNCGDTGGYWRASADGSFIVTADATPEDCIEDEETPQITPRWMARAVAFRIEGEQRQLLDQDGQVTASLTPLPDARYEMGLTSQARAAIDTEPAPLPASLRPATTADVIGSWVPADPAYPKHALEPFVTFEDDRDWVGLDSCDGSGGQGSWLVASNGRMLTTSTAQLAGGGLCTDQPGINARPRGLNGWIEQVKRAGLDGDVLVLVADDGQDLGRLARASESLTSEEK
jgi:hypothetical protein